MPHWRLKGALAAKVVGLHKLHGARPARRQQARQEDERRKEQGAAVEGRADEARARVESNVDAQQVGDAPEAKVRAEEARSRARSHRG